MTEEGACARMGLMAGFCQPPVPGQCPPAAQLSSSWGDQEVEHLWRQERTTTTGKPIGRMSTQLQFLLFFVVINIAPQPILSLMQTNHHDADHDHDKK